MKFGIRKPSLKKRIAARNSVKRIIRHNMGVKIPRGGGILTNPKKATYNKIYNKTTVSSDKILKSQKYNNPNINIDSEENNIKKISRDYEVESNKSISGSAFIIIGIIGLFINFFTGILLIILGIYLKELPKEKNNAKNKFLDSKDKIITNDYKEALILLNDAKDIFENESQKSITLDKINKLYGIIYYNLGNNKKAIKYLSKFDSIEDKVLIAELYFDMKEYKESISILQKIPDDEKTLKMIIIMGNSFYKLGKSDLAINVFKLAPLRKKILDEELKEIHYGLVLAYKDIGDNKKSKNHFNKVYYQDIEYKNISNQLESLEK